ncbi:MAG: hypothetical protein HC765_14600, partial [Brachymonas sp.]|nr:hypothetical protein [Brachymonas sp.]
ISKKAPYDPIAQFEPVGLVGSAPIMLVTKPSLKFKDLKEFAAYAKANKDNSITAAPESVANRITAASCCSHLSVWTRCMCPIAALRQRIMI